MLRIATLLVVLVGLAFPASAAVMVDPSDPANSSKTVFTAQGFTGTKLGGEFTLLSDASQISASVSASSVAEPPMISMFKVTSGMTTLIEGTVAGPLPGLTTVTFAGLEGPLEAGTYALELTGSFTNAAISADLTAVPLPAGLALFGTAIAGLGAYRRFGRRTA